MAAPTPTQMLYPQILSVGLGGNNLDFVDIAAGALGHRVKANIAVDDLNQYFQWGRSGSSAVGSITDMNGFKQCLNCAFDDGFTDLDADARGLSFTTGVLRNRNNVTGTINDLVTAYILYAVYGSSATDTGNKFFSISNLKSMLTDDMVSSILGDSLTLNSGSSGYVDQMFQYLVSSDPVRFVRDGMIVTMNPNETSGNWSFATGDSLQFVLKFQFTAPVTQVTLGLSDMNNVVGVANGQAPQPRTIIPAGQIFCVTLQLQAMPNRSPRRIAQLNANSPPSAPLNVVLSQGLGGELVASWLPPSSTGNSSITGYTLVLTDDQGSAPISVTATSSPYTFSYLLSTSVYAVTISASNSAGTGASVTSSTASPLEGSIMSVPSAPLNVTLTPTSTPGELLVTWDPPTNNGGLSLSQYILNLMGLNDDITVYTADSSPYTITGLDNTITYTISINASNNLGSGDGSASPARVSPL